MRKALPLTLTSSVTVVALLDQSTEPDGRPVANIRARKDRLAVGRAAGVVAETGSNEPGSRGPGLSAKSTSACSSWSVTGAVG